MMTTEYVESIRNGAHLQFELVDDRVKCKCGHNAVWFKTGHLCGTITAYPCKYNNIGKSITILNYGFK